jgi:hypothetical protein
MRAIACVGTMLLLVAGCASNSNVARVERENALLKEKVALLESQVAEMKAARTPLTINGITLAGPEVGDMRWAAKPIRWGESVRALDGSKTYASVGGGMLVSGAVGNLEIRSNESTWPLHVGGVGAIVNRPTKTGTAATTGAATTFTTTQSSTAPMLTKPAGNR